MQDNLNSTEKVLCELIELLDLEEFIKDKTVWNSLNAIRNSKCFSYVIQKTLESISCLKCRSRGKKMQCGHIKCLNCITSPCTTCTTLPILEDIEILKTQHCFICFQELKINRFAEDSCKHICIKCSLLEIAKDRNSCRICQNKFPLSLMFNNKVQCRNCKINFAMSQGYELNCGDFFCKRCLRKVCKRYQCIACSCSLLNTDFCGINLDGKVLCEMCEEVVDLGDIKKSECCYRDICLRCNGGTLICKLCG